MSVRRSSWASRWPAKCAALTLVAALVLLLVGCPGRTSEPRARRHAPPVEAVHVPLSKVILHDDDFGPGDGAAAPDTPPHEILLVIDGNTGQNAVAQVKSFDDALGLTGLIVTKLDGTAKGGVLAAIARERPVPVYFIGVGEKLEDLQTFSAREFAQALLH